MKKNEIRVGGLYHARVSGKYVTVRVDNIRERQSGYPNTRMVQVYDVTNLTTGRKTTFCSAAKFRGEVKSQSNEEKCLCGLDPAQYCLVHDVTRPSSVVMANQSEEDMVALPTAEDLVDSETTPLSFTLPTDEGDEKRSDPTHASIVADEQPNTNQVPGTVTGATATAGNNLAQRIASLGDGPKVDLTEEQAAILDAARAIEAAREAMQRVLVIGAGAGTGKTFTLKQLEQVLQGMGQYTAFNKSLVEESKTKFRKAVCNTSHSLAFREIGKRYAHRLNGNRVRSHEIAVRLGIENFTVELPASISPPSEDGKPATRTLKASFLAGQVIAAIRRFCQSDAMSLSTRFFSQFPGLDESGSHVNSDRVKDYLYPFMQKMWVDKSDPDGTMPFSHDDYVKLWQLGQGTDRPVIAADYILLDEAQDTAPVMLDILRRQEHAMLILVGDDNQQIYEWRGAVNAMATFPDAPRKLLSQSFRFGQVVADVANAVLATLDQPTDLVMRGLKEIPSRVCPIENPKCYLYRTNAGAVARLMRAREEGKSGHLIGGSKEVVEFCKAAADLQAKRGTMHTELGCFQTWEEVQVYSKEEEGADLRLIVKLIDEFGAAEIADALERMPAEKDADIVLSTAHRSKGREWPSVQIGPDFPTANKLTDADRRLLYVACTRAQEELDITKCPTFCGGWDKSEGADNPKFIPGIKIEYTAEMPDVFELWAYRDRMAKKASRIAPVATSQVRSADVPTQAVQPATNGNGDNNTWSRGRNNDWVVRGKPGQSGMVKVMRKNGTSSMETIKRVIWQNGEIALYEV